MSVKTKAKKLDKEVKKELKKGEKSLKKDKSGKKGKYTLAGVGVLALSGLTAYGIVRGGNKKANKK